VGRPAEFSVKAQCAAEVHEYAGVIRRELACPGENFDCGACVLFLEMRNGKQAQGFHILRFLFQHSVKQVPGGSCGATSQQHCRPLHCVTCHVDFPNLDEYPASAGAGVTCTGLMGCAFGRVQSSSSIAPDRIRNYN
jgi:hypothetical protein